MGMGLLADPHQIIPVTFIWTDVYRCSHSSGIQWIDSEPGLDFLGATKDGAAKVKTGLIRLQSN